MIDLIFSQHLLVRERQIGYNTERKMGKGEKMTDWLLRSNEKRYYQFSRFLKERFGGRVSKIPLNAGFTCPNRDGTRGTGGCTYCSSLGSGDFGGDPSQSLLEQFAQMRQKVDAKWESIGYLAYFQANTNTYGSVEQLRRCFEPILAQDKVVGLSIATRADCLPQPVLDYLSQLARQTFLLVELGLQTIHDDTAQRINRCHSYEEFLTGFYALKKQGIPVCVHLINGLPGETREMMVESARQVGKLAPHSVKIHMLHLLRETPMAEQWLQTGFPLLEQEEYAQIVCDQLELLPPDTVIQRLTGDGDGSQLVAPQWTRNKKSVLASIDKELRRRDSMQGRRYTP